MQKSLIPLSFIALSLLSSAAHSQTWARVGGGSTLTNPDCFIGMNTADIPTRCAIGKSVWNAQGGQMPVGVYAGFGAGKHLITTPQDSKQFAWGCYGTVTGATSTTDGEANTGTIINTSCSSYPNKAAQVCRDIGRLWYLPAINELQTLFSNRNAIGGFLASNYYYLSSTKIDDLNASGTQFGNNQFGFGAGTIGAGI